jgi:hypothetical protein
MWDLLQISFVRFPNEHTISNYIRDYIVVYVPAFGRKRDVVRSRFSNDVARRYLRCFCLSGFIRLIFS